MKKTQRKDLLTTILGSAVSFFSVVMFVALGVGVFLGIHWMSSSLEAMADKAVEAGNAHDLEIGYAYGLTDDDLEQLASVEGVDEVDAGYIAYRNYGVSNGDLVIAVQSLPQNIDTFITCEGTLPENDDEVALEQTWAQKYDIKVGDTVELTSPSDDGDTRGVCSSTGTHPPGACVPDHRRFSLGRSRCILTAT